MDSDCNQARNEQPVSLPSDERAPAGPDDVTAAVAAMDARKDLRDARGRFATGGAAAMVTGARSEALANALAPARRELVEQITSDLGASADALPATLRRLVGAFTETTLLREAIFETMAGRPTTAKGHSRRLLGAYLQLIDRELRLGQAIGLERRARKVGGLESFLNGQEPL